VAEREVTTVTALLTNKAYGRGRPVSLINVLRTHGLAAPMIGSGDRRAGR
jgi:hypothetical protein